MNLEHFCKTIYNNFDKLTNKKLTLSFLSYHIKLLLWKKNKLKLGAITFEITEIKAYEFVLWEEVDIRYIRQDNTETDELKLENILKRYAWKWDFKNVFSLCLVILLFMILLYSHLYCWYCNNLPSLAFRDEKYIQLIHFSISTSFSYAPVGFFKKWIVLNTWLSQLLVEYCLTFNLLF